MAIVTEGFGCFFFTSLDFYELLNFFFPQYRWSVKAIAIEGTGKKATESVE